MLHPNRDIPITTEIEQMAKRGLGGVRGVRVRKIRHDENTRAKIQASQIVNRLMGHVLGKIEMTATQVSAGLGLLRKVVPDLSQLDANVKVQKRDAADWTRGELVAFLDNATDGGAGAIETNGSDRESDSVH